MVEEIKVYIDHIATIVETIGVVTILVGILYALVKYIINRKHDGAAAYLTVRQSVGKAILLGLEILIAADIMATIVTEPTLKSVSILGLIVIIRIVLSLSLQVELEGRFPWEPKRKS